MGNPQLWLARIPGDSNPTPADVARQIKTNLDGNFDLNLFDDFHLFTALNEYTEQNPDFITVLKEFESSVKNDTIELNLDDYVDYFDDCSLHQIYRDIIGKISMNSESSNIGNDEMDELDPNNTKFNLIEFVCNDKRNVVKNEQILKYDNLDASDKTKCILQENDFQLTSQSNITSNKLNSVENINCLSNSSKSARSDMENKKLHEKESNTLHKPICLKNLVNSDVTDISDEEVDVITVDENTINFLENFKLSMRKPSMKKF
ncbi:uncharacterized protein LOC111625319 [Centruroides sculpturatus]|uniref:uncharacterized protein LOC111625319 n=1 Tax=Centruroides sculpturatus TaxID=218467 RepID=UPI000C6E176D|nr:uncharacterized protein LOC111625319 [Centruroides sculpturatus]